MKVFCGGMTQKKQQRDQRRQVRRNFKELRRRYQDEV
jgi:hypothetical protein